MGKAGGGRAGKQVPMNNGDKTKWIKSEKGKRDKSEGEGGKD